MQTKDKPQPEPLVPATLTTGKLNIDLLRQEMKKTGFPCRELNGRGEQFAWLMASYLKQFMERRSGKAK